MWLSRVFNAACPPGLDDETLLIFEGVPGECCSGLAWGRDSKFRGSLPHAYIFVPREPKFPQYPPPQNNWGASPGFTVELTSLEEALIYTVGHELAHLRYGPGERPAHAWGMRALRRYRRRGLPMPQRMRDVVA